MKYFLLLLIISGCQTTTDKYNYFKKGGCEFKIEQTDLSHFIYVHKKDCSNLLHKKNR